VQPILTAPLFAPLHDELVRLLRSLTADEWNARAVGTWSVKDVAAHLLDTSLRRLSGQRDHYLAPLDAGSDLAAIINAMNAQWVTAAQRLSPAILVEMIDRYGREMAEHIVTIDPDAPGIGVSWAGDRVSPNWFDTARELTERWHHQQQIRDATRRPALYDLLYFKPVMDTFLRGLPFGYRNKQAVDGTTIAFHIRDVTNCSLVRNDGQWQLTENVDHAATVVHMNGDTAWRLFTKGIAREEARRRSDIEGDAALAEPLFSMVAIVA
jgi:uncharacterized protein (TIGR03083 family)